MMHDGGFRMDTEYCRSLCVGVWQKGHTDQHHFRCWNGNHHHPLHCQTDSDAHLPSVCGSSSWGCAVRVPLTWLLSNDRFHFQPWLLPMLPLLRKLRLPKRKHSLIWCPKMPRMLTLPNWRPWLQKWWVSFRFRFSASWGWFVGASWGHVSKCSMRCYRKTRTNVLLSS